jgi:hypothetical protein
MFTQIGPINRYVVSNVSHRPVRTLLSVLAIAVEVTMILTLVGLSYGTLDATARRTRGVGADIIIRPPGSSIIGLRTAPMTDRLLAVLMKQPHVTLATGTVVQLSISSVGLLRNFFGVVIGVAVVVGFIVVYMAMYTAVLERTREIGMLKSLGASSPLILSMLLKETLLFACLGVLAGILLTYGTQWTMAHLVPSSLNQETVYAWWPLAAAIAGALLGAIVPITKAMRQDVTDALAYE